MLKQKEYEEMAREFAGVVGVRIVTVDGKKAIVEGDSEDVEDFKVIWGLAIKGGEM